jgi:hypothetical protein
MVGMGIKDFHKDVKHEGGYILSDGTLKYEHLLSKAYDLLEGYNIRNSGLRKDILSVFNSEPVFPLHNQVYYGLEIASDKTEEARYVWGDDVFDFFNSIAPKGYYFGCSEGDGACIGWFVIEEE